MAANSRAIKLDVNGKPAPQFFNPTADDYEYLLGEAGAARSILYGPDGQALSVVNRKLEVRATELEERLGATTDAAQTNPAVAASQIALLKGLLTKLQDPATQTTLAAVHALLDSIRTTDGIKRIADAVDVADRAARLLGKVTADDGAIAALGALADAAKTDPAQAASVIALLKGLLQTLRADSAKVQLTGSSAPEGGTPPPQILAIGGRYDANPRTLQSGQHGAIALTPEGRVIVELMAQDFRLFTNQVVTAGASVISQWIDANGYNALGVFIEWQGQPSFSWKLHVSPVGGIPYATHEAFVSGEHTATKSAARRYDIGHARYVRIQVTNTSTFDATLTGVWFQLIF